MSIVKGSNSQLQQDRANLKKEKRNLPFSSSSSSSSENEDDDLPPNGSTCQFTAFFPTVTQPTTLFARYLLGSSIFVTFTILLANTHT
ncbi:hypothetical protein Pcinc_024861 [Petrolisthes cinctipes]|uniref:Uncharacterized protein n=1 Tax=Petrolisthes cinctipes TaxID=88211 RepID=A0AAE1KCX8_PETCI|nr:hypothetical protein Pcinc_024861 [Petrolisthes cinctipes]